ncbi:hypothetical protein [Panacibacter ginsenosidivorans]|uniref:hypothetical protein n=1 Tax=Panacibacter ginsenosidivorans TaxID=1813871 RepID=UPI0013156434|nr:hypothetical protein [Panacibacter ginsenosidivorans]
MQRRSGLLIGLITAVITFATLTVFAKPYYAYGKRNHNCWHKEQSTHTQSDSAKNNLLK